MLVVSFSLARLFEIIAPGCAAFDIGLAKLIYGICRHNSSFFLISDKCGLPL